MARIRFAIWKWMNRQLSSNLNTEARLTICAQKDAKNNLKPGPSSMHVSRKKTV